MTSNIRADNEVASQSENCLPTKVKKRDLSAIGMSSESTNKRRKLSKAHIRTCNVETHKNVKDVFLDNNEATENLKTRTLYRRKLTAENLKTILRYVLANKSVLAMVQNTMKTQKENKLHSETEGQSGSSEPNEKKIAEPLWSVFTPRKLGDVCKKLLEEEYSEESESDEDYEPNDEELSDEDISMKEDDLNSSKAADSILSDFKRAVEVSDDEDALVIALPETDVSRDKEVDKIAQRTRSKMCLNNTPLEVIESSFQPPDIPLHMNDTNFDEADWEEFLRDVTKPLNQESRVGSVVDDTEDDRDPEFKIQDDTLFTKYPNSDLNTSQADKIARRTRSKFCLNDTPLESLVSSFHPPDITVDMYDTNCDDADWKEFICEFTKPLNEVSHVGSVADDTEDEKDPEYKVQDDDEEEDEEEDLCEGCDSVSGENPLEVPCDELNDLMTETLEFTQPDKILLDDFSFLEELSLSFSENDKNVNSTANENNKLVSGEKESSSIEECTSNDLEADINAEDSIGKESKNESQEVEVSKSDSENVPQPAQELPSSSVPIEIVRKEWIIPDERRQLDEQMRMYVQLLTQSYLLSCGFQCLNFINESSRLFLSEIKLLASLKGPNSKQSAFYAHNLDNAIDIVVKFDNLPEANKAKSQKMNKSIPDIVKKVLASNEAFIYPELLPKSGFHTFFCGIKASFSVAEDNLIALGLEQFSCIENPFESIKKFLLPTKSTHQIKSRVKNSRQNKQSENAIAYFCKYNRLPEFHRVIRIFDPKNVKPPEEYPPSALPAWMESYSKITQRNIERQKLSSQVKKPKLILPRIQIVPTAIQEVTPQDPPGAPQPLICKVYSVNDSSKAESVPIFPKRINRKRKKLRKDQVNKSTQYPESSDISTDSYTQQTIKQEPHSEESSDAESVENGNTSDSSSEFISLHSPVLKSNYSLRKRTLATQSTSTDQEMCQIESSLSNISEIVSVKEEPSSTNSSNEEWLESNSATHPTFSEIIKSKTLNNLPNQVLIDSALTEPSLKIVTSQGDESSDSEQSIAECVELFAPIQRFNCSIIEDAVLPPETNSTQKHLPSDFSTIRDIICSEEKREKLLNSDETKAHSKKANKSKKNWSMEEDQLIISNCQRYGINKRAFRASADEIGALTPLKVKQRFIYLLKLLSEKLKNGNESQ